MGSLVINVGGLSRSKLIVTWSHLGVKGSRSKMKIVILLVSALLIGEGNSTLNIDLSTLDLSKISEIINSANLPYTGAGNNGKCQFPYCQCTADDPVQGSFFRNLCMIDAWCDHKCDGSCNFSGKFCQLNYDSQPSASCQSSINSFCSKRFDLAVIGQALTNSTGNLAVLSTAQRDLYSTLNRVLCSSP